jgi:hypothetical protein
MTQAFVGCPFYEADLCGDFGLRPLHLRHFLCGDAAPPSSGTTQGSSRHYRALSGTSCAGYASNKCQILPTLPVNLLGEVRSSCGYSLNPAH